MRRKLTADRLRELMREIARRAPAVGVFPVFVLGGGTAVLAGWRESTIDADLFAEDDSVFREIQAIKELLEVNVEFVRPEDFVPGLTGSQDRHLFIDTVGRVSFYHYDPCSQLLSKIVRGFRRDLLDAEQFLASGMVDAEEFRSLVRAIPEIAYSRYPALSRQAVLDAVEGYLDSVSG